MALAVIDASSITQYLPQSVDPAYRFAGTITAAQAAADDVDVLLLTGPAAGTVARIVSAKFWLLGGGTAQTAGIVLDMRRVVAAPTGQTNVSVTATQHDDADAAVSTTCKITPSTAQTKGLTPTILGQTAFGLALSGTADAMLEAIPLEIECGMKVGQKPVVLAPAKFITFHIKGQALPANSILAFDLLITEAAH